MSDYSSNNIAGKTNDPFDKPRKSKDPVVNRFGQSLIDLRIALDIHIMHGRCSEDIVTLVNVHIFITMVQVQTFFNLCKSL